MINVSKTAVIISLATLLLFTAWSLTRVTSQTPELQPRFNDAFDQVLKAETFGAKPAEIAQLLARLNNALELNESLTTSVGDQRRAQILTQLDDALTTVQANATQLQAIASERTYTNRIISYVSGVIAAFLGTIVYAYGTVFWRRYRVKRTFQMRVVSK